MDKLTLCASVRDLFALQIFFPLPFFTLFASTGCLHWPSHCRGSNQQHMHSVPFTQDRWYRCTKFVYSLAQLIILLYGLGQNTNRACIIGIEAIICLSKIGLFAYLLAFWISNFIRAAIAMSI